MQRLLGIGGLVLMLLAVLLALPACNKTTDSAAGPPPGGPPFGPPGMGGPGFRPPGPIGEVMTKLTKGPDSLTSKIKEELKEDPPPWDTIQPQTKEYVSLAKSMSKYDPPKGSKESWQKQTDAYTKLATEMDKAAQAKDKDKTLAAHTEITHSCKGCHDEHRIQRPGGFGPPGGWPPGGGPPGGWPPGGGRPGGPPGGGPPGDRPPQ